METMLKGCLRPCSWTLRKYCSSTAQIGQLFPNKASKSSGHNKREERQGLRPSEDIPRKPITKQLPITREKKKQIIKRLTNTLEYEILSADDHRLGRTILQMKSKQGRMENQEILLEGANQVIEALKANGTMKAFYFSNPDLLKKFPLGLIPPDIPLYKVPNFKLNLFTDLTASPGILGIFGMPPEGRALCPPERQIPVTLICDGIQDPNVLGNLLQSAAAVGCQKVFLMKGCCDAWSSKTLRSSGLSQFHLPIFANASWSRLQSALGSTGNLNVYLVNRARIRTKQSNKEVTKAWGNEEQSTESLGEDGNLLEWQTIHADIIDDDISASQSPIALFLSDEGNNASDESNTGGDKAEQKVQSVKFNDDLYNDPDHLAGYRNAPVVEQCFDEVDFTSGHSVIIVEEKSSLVAKKFVCENEGEVLRFPIASRLYGLMSATAGALVLFEADKQHRRLSSLREK